MYEAQQRVYLTKKEGIFTKQTNGRFFEFRG